MVILSNRLRQIAQLVECVPCVCDIGTDHAYLPAALIKMNKAKRVIAIDVREKPLKRAEENLRREGVWDYVELRLSDGAARLMPGEAQIVTMTGMGGSLICRIINDNIPVFKALSCMYLGPQSELMYFRKTLLEMGFNIADEWLIKEDGKFYFIIKVVCGAPALPYSRAEQRYGRELIKKKDAVLAEYLMHERGVNERILKKLKACPKNTGVDRVKEIENELKIIDSLIGEIKGENYVQN